MLEKLLELNDCVEQRQILAIDLGIRGTDPYLTHTEDAASQHRCATPLRVIQQQPNLPFLPQKNRTGVLYLVQQLGAFSLNCNIVVLYW